MYNPHLYEEVEVEERFNDTTSVIIAGGSMLCQCGNRISVERYNAGYHYCMACGDKKAKKTIRTIVPLHKSNYMVVGDKSSLKGLNKNPL